MDTAQRITALANAGLNRDAIAAILDVGPEEIAGVQADPGAPSPAVASAAGVDPAVIAQQIDDAVAAALEGQDAPGGGASTVRVFEMDEDSSLVITDLDGDVDAAYELTYEGTFTAAGGADTVLRALPNDTGDTFYSMLSYFYRDEGGANTPHNVILRDNEGILLGQGASVQPGHIAGRAIIGAQRHTGPGARSRSAQACFHMGTADGRHLGGHGGTSWVNNDDNLTSLRIEVAGGPGVTFTGTVTIKPVGA